MILTPENVDPIRMNYASNSYPFFKSEVATKTERRVPSITKLRSSDDPSPILIFLDIDMNGEMDGLRSLRRLKSDPL